MIEIVPNTSRWADEFQQIGSKLRRALGESVRRIDHIGSTSVPGLDAKDVIDIQITVGSFNMSEQLEHAMSSSGYILRKDILRDHAPPGSSLPPVEWEKRFFNALPDQRRTNIHVRVDGRANQRYALLFRDYLRAHPATANAYCAVKRALARLHPDDVEAYYDVKDPVCDIIMVGAEDWARATGWRPGRSDI